MPAKLLTKANIERLLANGRASRNAQSKGEPEPDHLPVVKLFTPDAGATWILTEMDEDGDTLFGLCDLGLGSPELGYVSLKEIQSVRGRLRLPVERDLYFTATAPISNYADKAMAAGRIVDV